MVRSILLLSGLAALLGSVSGLTGDSVCGHFMCVHATLSDNVAKYTLSWFGRIPAGWMAVGFGDTMIDTPMVIMWNNTDGSATLSQRMATAYMQPFIDSNPPFQASISTAAEGEWAFTIPWDGQDEVQLIYAFAAVNTNYLQITDPNQHIQPHFERGYGHLDLTRPIQDAQDVSTNDNTATKPSSKPQSASGPSLSEPGLVSGPRPKPKPTPISTSSSKVYSGPLNASQRYAFAHAIFCAVGFLLFLPAGALVARWFRTITPAWYTAHWVAQFAAAGPTILIGVVFGVQAIDKNRVVMHLNDTHKKWGAALVVLYGLQCALGAFIHWVKPKNSTGRPLQNYVHAVVGIILVGLGFYQVRSGIQTEWPMTTGRPDYMAGAQTLWYIWAVLLPILYFGGLSLLPKQLKIERGILPLPTSEEKAASGGEQTSLLTESAEPDDYRD